MAGPLSRIVLPPLDLEIHDGEFVVFAGPSGSGKPTLLLLLAATATVLIPRLWPL